MEIKEFENGSFQVWHEGRVLDPESLTLEPNNHSELNHMYISTIVEAQVAAAAYKAKLNIVKTHPIDQTMPMNTIKITMAALVLVFAYSLADHIERTNAPINADIRINTLEKE